MGKRLVILQGDRFDQLTIVKEVEPFQWKKYKKRMFLCKCKCGQETVVRLEYLRSGHTKSCGCGRTETSTKNKMIHGYTGTRIYAIWCGMKKRCYNKNVKSYKDYGAKGVKVCDEWKEFEPFCEWALNNGYSDNLTIERINPFGNYEPSNCEWIPKSDQSKNRRCHIKAAND